MKISSKLLLLGIIVIAFVLRTWNLGSDPISLNWDEVAFGYNAYTLGIDGRDEFGRLLPYTYLESFGDFKPPLYAYLTVIPIWLFGLQEFAVRLPSALFGTLTVLLTYFLVPLLFPKQKHATSIGLFSAFLLAISPWHVNLSRGAYEANVATFLVVGGVVTFLIAMHGRKWFLLISVISFTLSLYTFNTARIVVPLFVLVLGLLFLKKVWSEKLASLLSVALGLMMFLPLLGFLLSPQAALRFNEVNIFSDITVVERTNQEIENDNHASWSKVLHNRRLAYGVEYLKHYLDTFSPAFLFIEGDENFRFGTRDLGLLYLFEAPFLLIGLVMLFRKREGYWYILPLWIVIAIIPAATARETPHALRLLTLIPTLQVITAYGGYYAYRWFITQKFSPVLQRISFVLASSVVLLSVMYYLYGYYVFYPSESARSWSDGYKESVLYVQSVYDEYDRFVITSNMGRPYIYYLFYGKVSPTLFRETAEVNRDTFGFVNVQGFDKYRFEDSLSVAASQSGKVLYIDVAERVPDSATIQKVFLLPDGTERLKAYTL